MRSFASQRLRSRWGAAGRSDQRRAELYGVLAAIAPIVGTAPVVPATGKIVHAVDVAIEVADTESGDLAFFLVHRRNVFSFHSNK